MRIAILIAGYLRSFQINIKHLKKNLIGDNDADIYLYKISDEEHDKYNNTNSWNNIKKELSIKIIIESDNIFFDKDDKTNNILNQFYKFYILNNIKNETEKHENIKYDVVIKWRPDILLHEKIHLDITNNKITIPIDAKMDINKLLHQDDKYICDIIAYGSSINMNAYFNFFLHIKELINKYGLCQETLLYHYIHNNNIDYDKLPIEYSVILSICNILSISGNSGSGKTSIGNYLKMSNSNSFILECDRYHKWERGNHMWNSYTHLNPQANYLIKMQKDIFDLKIGNDIYQVDYNHTTGKFTDKEYIKSKDTIIVCGLHTLYNNVGDIKIFMDTMEDLNKIWKIKRDIKKRSYTIEKVLKQIEDRKNDYIKYILPQKHAADIIINFYTDDTINFENLDIEYNIKLNILIKKEYDIKIILENLCSTKKKFNLSEKYYEFNFSDKDIENYYKLILIIINSLNKNQ